MRQVHALLSHFTRPSLVRHAGGRGALRAFGVFEKPAPVFRPTPSAPGPQTIQDARDVNKWRATMNSEIENMSHLRIFTAVARRLNTTIIAPRWVSTGTSRMAHLSRQGTPSRTMIRPNLRCRLSAAHLHGDIDGEVYTESPSEYGDRSSVLEGDGTRPRAETHVYLIIPNYIQMIRVYTAARGRRRCSSLRRGGGRTMTRREKHLQLGGRITEPPNGGTQLWTLSTLNHRS